MIASGIEAERAATRWYVLFVMTLVYAINIADRYVVSTLIEPIRMELGLTDAGVGFLTGVALAIFYVTAGIPLGVLADRANRRNMIALSLAAWSAMTGLCGVAQNFWQLLLARIGVGIGEAGGTPPSQSIVADRFPPAQRSVAMSLFAVGAALGGLLGSSGGGWVAEHHGWRMTLILFGFLGLPLAVLVWLTIVEPRRGRLDHGPEDPSPATLRQTLEFIRRSPALLHLYAGAAVITFWGWGTVWWAPAFLMRSHGLSIGEAGALLGPMHGIGGTAVMLTTAWWLARHAGENMRRQAWLIAATTLLATVPSVLAFSAGSLAAARLAFWIFVPITYLYIGPHSGLLQNLVPPGMRAQAFALVLFVANIANLVIAPQLIGFASDVLAARISSPSESLRYALVASAFMGIWAAWHYYAAGRAMPARRGRTLTSAEAGTV